MPSIKREVGWFIIKCLDCDKEWQGEGNEAYDKAKDSSSGHRHRRKRRYGEHHRLFIEREETWRRPWRP